MSNLIKCGDCNNDISKHAKTCVHCGSPVLREANNPGLETYQVLSNPLGYIIFYWAIWLVIFYSLAVFLDNSFLLTNIFSTGNLEKKLFIVYTSGFTGMWTAYFLSKCRVYNGKECEFIRYRTLRRLLGECSAQWRINEQDDKTDEIEDSFRRKSSTSIDVIAILIAVAILQLDQVTSLLHLPPDSKIYNRGDDGWEDLMLFLGATSAILAFISFTLSIDALDVIFNKFKTKKDRHSIIHYFYLYTINPKYIGFISIITGVIFISAVYNFYFACMGIGITAILGRKLWFPDVKLNNHDENCENIEAEKGTACGAKIDDIFFFIFVKMTFPIIIIFAPIALWLIFNA